MFFRIFFLVWSWARVGHKKICIRLEGQTWSSHVSAQKVCIEAGTVATHTHCPRSAGWPFWHGKAVGPTVPTRSHPSTCSTPGSHVCLAHAKGPSSFCRSLESLKLEVVEAVRDWCRTHFTLAGATFSCNFQFVLTPPYVMLLYSSWLPALLTSGPTPKT